MHCELHLFITMTSYGRNGVSNHKPHDCLLNRLCRRRSKKTSKLRVTGLAGISPGTDEFLALMATKAENVSIWWRHHVTIISTNHLIKWADVSIYRYVCFKARNQNSQSWFLYKRSLHLPCSWMISKYMVMGNHTPKTDTASVSVKI